MGNFGGCAIFVQFWLAVGKQVVIIAPRNPPPRHFVSPGRHCPCLWHEWVPAQEMLAFASQVERTCRLECSCPRPRDLAPTGSNTEEKSGARNTKAKWAQSRRRSGRCPCRHAVREKSVKDSKSLESNCFGRGLQRTNAEAVREGDESRFRSKCYGHLSKRGL